MPSFTLSPSVLAADFGSMAAEAAAIRAVGAEWLHLDVMDGVFVPNISFGPDTVRAVRRASDAFLDVHLMIARPDDYIQAFADAGADMITVHAEAGPHVHRTLASIRKAGRKVGIALNPGTPEEAIRYVLDDIDLVLVMSVDPGFGGQSFIPGTLDKIRRIRGMLGGATVDISVDGGVTDANVRQVVEAGASVIVAGSSVFAGGSGAYGENVARLRARAA